MKPLTPEEKKILRQSYVGHAALRLLDALDAAEARAEEKMAEADFWSVRARDAEARATAAETFVSILGKEASRRHEMQARACLAEAEVTEANERTNLALRTGLAACEAERARAEAEARRAKERHEDLASSARRDRILLEFSAREMLWAYETVRALMREGFAACQTLRSQLWTAVDIQQERDHAIDRAKAAEAERDELRSEKSAVERDELREALAGIVDNFEPSEDHDVPGECRHCESVMHKEDACPWMRARALLAKTGGGK